MKKKALLPAAAMLLVIILAAVFYFTPKTFGKNVDPSDVDHINVFDGTTGVGFTIDDPDDIKYIVENIPSHTMKRDGISLGSMGYSLKISYVDSNDMDVIPVFILNSDDTIRKDPFFYTCDGGLCFDYIKELEQADVSTIGGVDGPQSVEIEESEPNAEEYVVTISKSSDLSNGIVLSTDEAAAVCSAIALSESENGWVNDISKCAVSCYILIENSGEKTTCRYCDYGVLDDTDNVKSLKLTDEARDTVNEILSTHITLSDAKPK